MHLFISPFRYVELNTSAGFVESPSLSMTSPINASTENGWINLSSTSDDSSCFRLGEINPQMLFVDDVSEQLGLDDVGLDTKVKLPRSSFGL